MVTAVDIPASSWVIHVFDSALLPPDMVAPSTPVVPGTTIAPRIGDRRRRPGS
jgi:hypothetical protein